MNVLIFCLLCVYSICKKSISSAIHTDWSFSRWNFCFCFFFLSSNFIHVVRCLSLALSTNFTIHSFIFVRLALICNVCALRLFRRYACFLFLDLIAQPNDEWIRMFRFDADGVAPTVCRMHQLDFRFLRSAVHAKNKCVPTMCPRHLAHTRTHTKKKHVRRNSNLCLFFGWVRCSCCCSTRVACFFGVLGTKHENWIYEWMRIFCIICDTLKYTDEQWMDRSKNDFYTGVPHPSDRSCDERETKIKIVFRGNTHFGHGGGIVVVCFFIYFFLKRRSSYASRMHNCYYLLDSNKN